MSHPVTTLSPVEKVSHIVDVLTVSNHDGFPVVQGYNHEDFVVSLY